MVFIEGKGVLKPFSQAITFSESVPVSCIPEMMKLPETYREEIIAIRDGRVLSLDESLNDGDKIQVFIAAMGG